MCSQASFACVSCFSWITFILLWDIQSEHDLISESEIVEAAVFSVNENKSLFLPFASNEKTLVTISLLP